MISTVPELFRSLSKHSTLLEGLFEKRERNISLRETKSDASLELWQQLSDDGIVEIMDDNVALDDYLLTYLEHYFNAGDAVELLDYDNFLKDLEHHISISVSTNKLELSKKSENVIRKILRKLPMNLLRNIAVIHRHVELTYKVAADPEEKMKELRHYREKLDTLLSAEAKVTTKLRVHRDGFFGNYAGQDLRLQYYRLIASLHDLRSTIIDLNNEVIDYINKLSQNTHFHKHILRLNDLRIRHEIKERTNMLQLLSEDRDDLVLIPQQRDRALLSQDFAQSIDFIEIIEQISMPKEMPLPTKQRARAIPRELLSDGRIETTIDFDQLYNLFVKSGDDLFTFVTSYPYESTLTDEDRLFVYLQLATTYANKLQFIDKPLMFIGYRCMTIYPKGADI